MKSLEFLLCFLMSQSYVTMADLISSISDMMPLLDSQRSFIDALDSYILSEEHRISNLKKRLHLFEKEHELAIEDIPAYLGNPITAFKLINRLSTELQYMADDVSLNAVHLTNLTTLPDLKFPTADDIVGAAAAVARVMDIYKLNVTQLADRRYNGIGNDMSSSECFELGRALYDLQEYQNSLHWMFEALRKFEFGDRRENFSVIDIYEYIGYTYYILGNFKLAVEWTKKLLALDPGHLNALKNQALFEDMDYNAEFNESYQRSHEAYGKLCRGEIGLSEKVTKGLSCRYLSDRHPFLRLAPIKQEQVHANPDIFLFHEVLSDDEIREIRQQARPKLYLASTINTDGGSVISSNYRTGKSAFLGDLEFAIGERLNRRISAMTGLDTLYSEQLQVVDYGPGGHYGPHTDCLLDLEKVLPFESSGNRLATVLFYMSDVAQGGETVFTELGLSVPPLKGSAVFWLNLTPSADCDKATRHASCPVLSGSKWISTKWLHEARNELLRPCALDYEGNQK